MRPRRAWSVRTTYSAPFMRTSSVSRSGRLVGHRIALPRTRRNLSGATFAAPCGRAYNLRVAPRGEMRSALLELKPDTERTLERMDAFWEREILDRPWSSSRCPGRPRSRSPSPSRTTRRPRSWLDIDFQTRLRVANVSNVYLPRRPPARRVPEPGAGGVLLPCTAARSISAITAPVGRTPSSTTGRRSMPCA